MTTATIALTELAEKGADIDVLRQMVQFMADKENAKLSIERDLRKKQRSNPRRCRCEFGFVAKIEGPGRCRSMCETLGVARSGSYAWLGRPRSKRSLQDEVLGSQGASKLRGQRPDLWRPARPA